MFPDGPSSQPWLLLPTLLFLSWTNNTTSVAIKAQNISKFPATSGEYESHHPSGVLYTIDSVLTGCIAASERLCQQDHWYPLPSLTDILHTCLSRRTISVAADSSQTSHSHFSLLPSGRPESRCSLHRTVKQLLPPGSQDAELRMLRHLHSCHFAAIANIDNMHY